VRRIQKTRGFSISIPSAATPVQRETQEGQ
jgi:hypothetical protein